MLIYVSLVGMVLVAIVLALGIWNMAKGGSPSRSQKLMRMRIIVQFAAVVAVMLALYVST